MAPLIFFVFSIGVLWYQWKDSWITALRLDGFPVEKTPRLNARADNALFDEDVPRCPNCGKRIDPALSVCPACGYALVPHPARVRCKHCGKRIPADAAVCPRCQADRSAELARAAQPRRAPKFARGVAFALAALCLLCVGWLVYRVVVTTVLPRGFAANTATPAPTQVVYVIHVVVTPIPSPTRAPSPTARAAPTLARRSATMPASGAYAAPRLSGPADKTVYTGADANILLEWQPVSTSGLGEDEWYAVSISYTTRERRVITQTRWSKETRWSVPRDWRDDAAPDAPTFQWQVVVVRVAGSDPLTAPTRTPISPASATRVFIWH